MLNNKLAIVIMLVFLFALIPAGVAFAAAFSDVDEHWAVSEINTWASEGLTVGYADGTFKPYKEVTRAEYVAMVNRAFAFAASPGTGAGTEVGFVDVKPQNWYYNDVMLAKALGYMGGYDGGTFKPENAISRQEAASVVARLLELPPAVDGVAQFADAGSFSDWSRGNAGAVVEKGIMLGMADNTFQPLKGITRAEAVVILERARSTASAANLPGDEESGDVVGGSTGDGEKDQNAPGPGGSGDGNKTGAGNGNSSTGGGSNSSIDTPPTVETIAFTVNNQSVTVRGSNNVFTIDLSGYRSGDRFTEITVHASKDAARAELTVLGRTKSIKFANGVAAVSVSEVTGMSTGISLQTLKSLLGLLGSNELTINVYDKTGNRTVTTVKVILPSNGTTI